MGDVGYTLRNRLLLGPVSVGRWWACRGGAPIRRQSPLPPALGRDVQTGQVKMILVYFRMKWEYALVED